MLDIKALLFDVDGTLLDTRDFIINATEHALRTHGFEVPTREYISRQVGIAFPQYYEIFTGIKGTQHLEDTHREYQMANYHLVNCFPNTVSTVRTLAERGYQLAAVTSRSKKTSFETLRLTGLEEWFKVVISYEDVKQFKPHPEPILKALEKLGLSPAEAAMIGDGHVDVEAGKSAGTKTVRAAYGFHTERLEEPVPDFIIHDIAELLNIFPTRI